MQKKLTVFIFEYEHLFHKGLVSFLDKIILERGGVNHVNYRGSDKATLAFLNADNITCNRLNKIIRKLAVLMKGVLGTAPYQYILCEDRLLLPARMLAGVRQNYCRPDCS